MSSRGRTVLCPAFSCPLAGASGGKGSTCSWSCSCRVSHTSNHSCGPSCQTWESGRYEEHNLASKAQLHLCIHLLTAVCYWENSGDGAGLAWVWGVVREEKAAAAVAVPRGSATGATGVAGTGTGYQMGVESIYLLTPGNLVAHFCHSHDTLVCHSIPLRNHWLKYLAELEPNVQHASWEFSLSNYSLCNTKVILKCVSVPVSAFRGTQNRK